MRGSEIEFRPLNLRDVSYIAANLRPDDAQELFVQRAYSDGYTLAQEVVYLWGGCSAVVVLKGQPVAALGITELQPGVWHAWAFGTGEVKRVIRHMSRYMMRTLVPSAIAVGARRVEARSRLNHHASHRWIKSMGAHGPVWLEEWGKDGSTFLLFWWTLSQFNKGKYPHVRSSSSSEGSAPSGPDSGPPSTADRRTEPGPGGGDQELSSLSESPRGPRWASSLNFDGTRG